MADATPAGEGAAREPTVGAPVFRVADRKRPRRAGWGTASSRPLAGGLGFSIIAFDRISGGKPSDITEGWYVKLLATIGQPRPVAAPAAQH